MVTCSNLKIKAYGKINLALDIVGKRDDGYHMLNTVMQSVSCFDLLDFTLSEGEGIELTCKLDSFPKGGEKPPLTSRHGRRKCRRRRYP